VRDENRGVVRCGATAAAKRPRFRDLRADGIRASGCRPYANEKGGVVRRPFSTLAVWF
jgi:hypothetical protein